MASPTSEEHKATPVELHNYLIISYRLIKFD